MTFPTRHHTPSEMTLAVGATIVMTVLFLLFERSFIWLAGIVAFVALLPLAGGGWTARQVYWRTAVAAVVVVFALLVWLT